MIEPLPFIMRVGRKRKKNVGFFKSPNQSLFYYQTSPKMMNKMKKAFGNAKDSAGRNFSYARGKSGGFSHPEAVEPHIVVRFALSLSSFTLNPHVIHDTD